MPSPTPEIEPGGMREVLGRLNESLLHATHPDQVTQSLFELESLARSLQCLENPSPAAQAELRGLQGDLRRAGHLVDSGLELQNGWARILGAAAAGYTADGEAAALTPSSQVSLEG